MTFQWYRLKYQMTFNEINSTQVLHLIERINNAIKKSDLLNVILSSNAIFIKSGYCKYYLIKGAFLSFLNLISSILEEVDLMDPANLAIINEILVDTRDIFFTDLR